MEARRTCQIRWDLELQVVVISDMGAGDQGNQRSEERRRKKRRTRREGFMK